LNAPGHGERVCAREGCGQTFTPKRSDAKYHSGACRAADNRTHRHTNNRPVRVAAVTAIRPPGPLTWDPPSEPRRLHLTTEECPHCAGPLVATPVGTMRGCPKCGHRVPPAGVRDAYDPSEVSAGRTVRSQDDRDDEGLALAERASELLAGIRHTLADDKLHHASRGRLEWYEAEIRTATRASQPGRVEHLAGKLGGESIRRQHFWQGQPPAAIEAPAWDEVPADDTGEVCEAEIVYEAEIVCDGEQLAIEAPRRAVSDFAAALAARDAAMEPNQQGRGLCHVIWPPPPGAPPGTPRRHCLGQARHSISGGAICTACHDALQRPLGG